MVRLFQIYYPIRNLFFVVGEGIAIFGSVLLTIHLLPGNDLFWDHMAPWIKVFVITFFCQICLYYYDLYDLKISKSLTELPIRLLHALGIASILLSVIYYLYPDAIIGTGVFPVSITIGILVIVAWRFLYHLVLSRGIFNQKIVLLGSSALAKSISNEISERKDCGYTISMTVRECDSEGRAFPSADFRKDFDGLSDLAKSYGIKKIIVAMGERRGSFPHRELLKCRMEGLQVIEGNSFYEMLTGKIMVEAIHPGWLIYSNGFRKSYLQRFFKPTIDIFFAFVLLVLFAPVILLISILIRLDSKGPVFFSQDRVGKAEKTYRIYKFRSMVDDAEKDCGPKWAEKDDHRVTRVGRYLRKFRMDELPQLYNVIKGEMSFVGPRPEREHFIVELEKEIPYYRLRLSVKPGITGWAQVSYEYGATLEQTIEKINYDLFYIKNVSIWFDLMIVFKTLKIVIFGTGAR